MAAQPLPKLLRGNGIGQPAGKEQGFQFLRGDGFGNFLAKALGQDQPVQGFPAQQIAVGAPLIDFPRQRPEGYGVQQGARPGNAVLHRRPQVKQGLGLGGRQIGRRRDGRAAIVKPALAALRPRGGVAIIAAAAAGAAARPAIPVHRDSGGGVDLGVARSNPATRRSNKPMRPALGV